jgi:hypothetical protein
MLVLVDLRNHLFCDCRWIGSPGSLTRPSLIRIKMEFQQQWYFFWILYMFEVACKKRKFSKKKGESALPEPPQNFVGPPLGPGTMQKESAQSDQPARRKRPKCGPILLFQNIPIFMNVLDVFSGEGDQMELIPFALCQASQDTSLEYPHCIIPRTLKFGP